MGSKNTVGKFLKKVRLKLINWRDDAYFSFFSYTINKKVEGEEITLLINDKFAKWWYSFQDEWTELKLINEHLLKEGDIVADCGANIGFTSMFFSAKVKETGHVYAFEALPKNADTITKNIALNKRTNISCINKAVGNKEEVLYFSIHGNGAIVNKDYKKAIPIDVILLDSFFVEQQPTVIKIDVEGFEYEVLLGASRILQNKPRLALELHIFSYTDKVQKLNDIIKLLQDHKYEHGIIQFEYEGRVEKLNWDTHTPDSLQNSKIVHLYLF